MDRRRFLTLALAACAAPLLPPPPTPTPTWRTRCTRLPGGGRTFVAVFERPLADSETILLGQPSGFPVPMLGTIDVSMLGSAECAHSPVYTIDWVDWGEPLQRSVDDGTFEQVRQQVHGALLESIAARQTG